MSDYSQGQVTATSTPALLCLVDAENAGVLVQNTGSVTAYVGGSTVTSSGDTQGLSIAAGDDRLIPSVGGEQNTLYVVTDSSTTTVVYLFPVC